MFGVPRSVFLYTTSEPLDKIYNKLYSHSDVNSLVHVYLWNLADTSSAMAQFDDVIELIRIHRTDVGSENVLADVSGIVINILFVPFDSHFSFTLFAVGTRLASDDYFFISGLMTVC